MYKLPREINIISLTACSTYVTLYERQTHGVVASLVLIGPNKGKVIIKKNNDKYKNAFRNNMMGVTLIKRANSTKHAKLLISICQSRK